MIPELYEHQKTTVEFMQRVPRGFNTSDPGTGKTRGSLEGFKARGEMDYQKSRRRLLVLCPLSIMQPAWGNDIDTYMPGMQYAIAHGDPKKRKIKMLSDVDIVITNHDSVNWIIADKSFLAQVREHFTAVYIDEFTAYKNSASQRSKAVQQITNHIPELMLLSGTPIPNTVLDIWFPALMVDGGARLGAKYFGFRQQVCHPVQTGPDANMIRWEDKPGVADIVADKLKDITIRFKASDCLDIPENKKTFTLLEPPKWLMDKYTELEDTSMLETAEGKLTPIHAGARVKKMLQLLSGAVYDGTGEVLKIHNERYELIMELIKERESCLVAYNWTHELRAMIALAEKEKIPYAFINGDVSVPKRVKIVEDFQSGKIKILFAHPRSAGHGLTLTKGTSTIWCSPTYNAEEYEQFNKRIDRAGQTKLTETIRIAYKGTKEVEVYEKLDNKITRMDDLLELFSIFSKN